MKKTIFVTGGAGFIGSAFVAQAVEKGYHVVVPDKLTYAGHRANLDWIKNRQGSWQLEVVDICDGAAMESLLRQHRPEALFHFAAESHVDNSIASPAAFIETNIIGTYRLLEAARAYFATLQGEVKERFRFIQVSTDEVYGTLGETGRFSETTAMRPNSPYSASKAAGDHLARAWHETYGLPTIITNCTNNYGPRQYPEKLIPLMISRALAGEALPIYGDGLNVRDWIYVDDHAAGVFLACEKGQAGEVYCFGGDAEKTNIEVVDTICEVLDALKPRADGRSYKEQKRFVQDRPGHDRRYAIDDAKAQRELGFTRSQSFASGIRATVEWYLANDAWCKEVTQHKEVA